MMNALLKLAAGLALCPSVVTPDAAAGIALYGTLAAASQAAQRDGQHDFDFAIGTWRTEVSLLRDPLSGSDTWAEYRGTSVVRGIWGGRANLVELDVAGPAGRIVGLNLRLYDPEARRWSLHYANSRNGALTPPVVGSFTNGRGEFLGKETLGGREILVKFVISPVAPGQWRYEQSFSADDGATWETNWIAIDTLESRDTS